MPVYPLEEWTVSRVRFTAFPQQPDRRMEDLGWWEGATGTEPEGRSSKTAPRLSQDYGRLPHGAGQLMLVVSPVRTDWLLTGAPNAADRVGVLGVLPGTLEPFLEVVRTWLSLPTRFQVQRMAFWMWLHHREDSRAEAYVRIGRFLERTVKLDPSGSRDFMYHINPVRESTVVDGLKLNRLNKWTALTGTLYSLGGYSRQLEADRSEEYLVTSLELDLSTAAEHGGSLPEDRLEALLNELVSHALSIASDGDRA